jgi:integrase
MRAEEKANGEAAIRIVGRARGARRQARAALRPLALFATGLRPGEWIALERHDTDHEARVVYMRRAYRNGRVK